MTRINLSQITNYHSLLQIITVFFSSSCKVQPRCASLGYPFHNTAAHTEAMPTREGI